MAPHKELYRLFADLLDYPSPALKGQADETAEALVQSCPEAADVFSGFYTWVKREKLTHTQEIYTSTFDLQGLCCPYVGHHLFGDSYQRNWFMAQLNGGYHARGFSSGAELPDHVAVILRFLGQAEEDEFSLVLVEEGLSPCLEKMIQAFDETSHHPYMQLLHTLRFVCHDWMANRTAEGLKAGEGGMGND